MGSKKSALKLGAELLVDTLIEQGVEVLFGFPGGAVLHIFDALHDCKGLRFVLVRHEQGAAHMADGYARASGKVGVCIATSGPGATNLVTGIATAHMDSVPIVAITGQTKTHLIGNDAFQEADTTGITRPITKHNYLVRDVRDLQRTIREAFHIASTGRPGPVLVDIPSDVSAAKCKVTPEEKIHLPGYQPTYEGHPRQIKRVAEAINAAERPVLYVGGGAIISGAHKYVGELAGKASIPTTTTLMALGAFPETDDLSLGMLGMHGTAYANFAVMEADLIVAIGARFDDRVTGKVETFAPHAKIVHIDIDPTAISKNIQVDIPVVGDAAKVLEELLPHVRERSREERAEWLGKVDEWKKRHPLQYETEGLRPQYVVEEIDRITGGKAVIVTEVGQNQMWAAQFYKYTEPRTFISSGGLGTMGFGLPAALGAKVARPDVPVFDIAGDGSIQMNIQELCTAVQDKLAVKVAILNNGYLGMVRQWQELFWNRRYSHTHLATQPDFVKLAEAYGAVGMRIDKKEDVSKAIEKALSIDAPVVMDFHVEPEENVTPMVPAGAAINEFELL